MDALEPEFIATGRSESRGKPRCVAVHGAGGAEEVGASIGDDGAVHVGNHDVEINGVSLEDHAETLAGVVRGSGAGVFERIDDGGVGGPPADVAGAFVEVAVNQVDIDAGKVAEPGVADIVEAGGKLVADFGEAAHAAFGFLLDGAGRGLRAVGETDHFLSDDGKAPAGVTGAGGFELCIERENAGLQIDVVDFLDGVADTGKHGACEFADAFWCDVGGHVLCARAV